MDEKNASSAGAIRPAEPLDLGSLVEYQDGSVVSRTVAKKNGGTITLFAFDELEGLSEHAAPFDALVQILEGQAELTIGGSRVIAGAGQTVLMPANVPHALFARTRFKMLLIMVREVTELPARP
jgi:quercetin dioxygenase-like cupin family protein